MISLKSLLESKERKSAGIFVIADDTKKVLLGLRAPRLQNGNEWGIPGGGMEPMDRSPEQTARREFKEETQYNGQMQLYPAYISKENNSTYYNFVGVVPYEFKAISDAETSRFQWIDIDDVPTISNLHWGIPSMLSDRKTMDIIDRIIG